MTRKNDKKSRLPVNETDDLTLVEGEDTPVAEKKPGFLKRLFAGKAKVEKGEPPLTLEDPLKTENEKSMGQALVDELKFFVSLFAGLMVFYTFIFGHFKIPTESMQPTLEVGDHIYASKFAYGYSKHSLALPFAKHWLPLLPDGKVMSKLPKRGDVVVFRNPNSGIVMIKRVVGLPGDEITMSRGRLYRHMEEVERTKLGTLTYRIDHGPRRFLDRIFGRNKHHQQFGNPQNVTVYSEQFEGEQAAHKIYENNDFGDVDDTAPQFVPEGTIFVMGDNRDRSLDSRANLNYHPDAPGLVPLDHVIGRADRMIFSFKKCLKEEGITCPKRQFMQPL